MRYPHVCLMILVLFGLAAPAIAQDVADLTRRRDRELCKEWLTVAAWTTDYDVARARARKSGKPILAYFLRSYAP